MAERILVADDDPRLRSLLETVLGANGFDVISVPDGDALVRCARETQPALLLIDVMMPVMDGLEALRQLRQDTRTSHLPMLMLSALAAPQHAVIGFESGADDYITKPFDNDHLVARIKANLRRASRIPVNNPLTGLPGNLLLEQEVSYRLRLDRGFALLWVDLDNFKSLNDAYGFARGDRVIRLVGDLVARLKRERRNDADFVAHIGGDDFVILIPPADAIEVCTWLIDHFDAAITGVYDQSDRERGYLAGIDRFGTARRFPIVSLTIGVVDTRRRKFNSYEEVARVAAEMKSFAKKASGSSYAVDERRGDVAAPFPERRGQPPLVVFACRDEALCSRFEEATRLGGSRTKAFDACASVDALLADSPDLLVFDTAAEDAWRMLDEVRAVAAALPVVMIVRSGGEDERAIIAGANAALPEDVSSEQFSITLAQLLRRDQTALPLDEPRP